MIATTEPSEQPVPPSAAWEEPYEIPEHLTDSRPIRWDRKWTTAGGKALLDHLLSLLEQREQTSGARKRARRGADRARLVAALDAILSDLYAASQRDPPQWLAYPRRREDYGQRARRYDHPQLTLTAVVTVVDFLGSEGLVETRPGSYRRRANPFAPGDIGDGYRSRMRATHTLVDLVEDRFGLTASDLGFASWLDPIRLKGATGPDKVKSLIDYTDTDETRRMRANIQAINGWIARHRVDALAAPAADYGAVRLYRVFNNGSFALGGRFYGGWWISATKEHRAAVTIDGEPTTELDFAGLHPRLMYQLEGLELPDDFDPYAIPGFLSPDHRTLAKKAFNQLVNSSPGMRLQTPAGAREVLAGSSYRAFIAAVEALHDPVRAWFRTGRGLELQRLDSDIAERVMLKLMDRGICCLPIHDSFIVPESAREALRSSMTDAYREVMFERTGRDCCPLIG